MSDLVKRLHALSNELVSIPDSLGEQFVVPNEAAAAIERKDAALRMAKARIDSCVESFEGLETGEYELKDVWNYFHKDNMDKALAAIDTALKE